jgi:hypothetical protein
MRAAGDTVSASAAKTDTGSDAMRQECVDGNRAATHAMERWGYHNELIAGVECHVAHEPCSIVDPVRVATTEVPS